MSKPIKESWSRADLYRQQPKERDTSRFKSLEGWEVTPPPKKKNSEKSKNANS